MFKSPSFCGSWCCLPLRHQLVCGFWQCLWGPLPWMEPSENGELQGPSSWSRQALLILALKERVYVWWRWGHCLDCVHIALIQSWLLLGGLGESVPLHPTLKVEEGLETRLVEHTMRKWHFISLFKMPTEFQIATVNRSRYGGLYQEGHRV